MVDISNGWGKAKQKEKKTVERDQKKGTSCSFSSLLQYLLFPMLPHFILKNWEITRELDVAILCPPIEGPLAHVGATLRRKLA